MDILFVAGFSPIVPDPTAGRSFYKDALGLPLREVEGDYIAVDGFEGSKHLGIWPLAAGRWPMPPSHVSGLANGPMMFRSPKPPSNSR